jgi:hypothetical protein
VRPAFHRVPGALIETDALLVRSPELTKVNARSWQRRMMQIFVASL